jgi:hypothetical protein
MMNTNAPQHRDRGNMNIFNAKTLEYVENAAKKRVKIQVFTEDAVFKGQIYCRVRCGY